MSREVIETTLQVAAELSRICLHPRAAFGLGRFLATFSDQLSQFRNLSYHPVVLRSCRHADDVERAVVAFDEIFRGTDISSEFTPMICELTETWNAFCVVDRATNRGKQGLSSVETLPFRLMQGSVAAVEHDYAVRQSWLVDGPLHCCSTPVDQLCQHGGLESLWITQCEYYAVGEIVQ